jgi:hypothetical protein
VDAGRGLRGRAEGAQERLSPGVTGSRSGKATQRVATEGVLSGRPGTKHEKKNGGQRLAGVGECEAFDVDNQGKRGQERKK